ncbi:MAG: hypothetical protein C4570_02470 [Ammonifex sp.]|nr:MAG: hypothetical protein C4570_02470 [Ammonifex sp.]
MRKFTDRITLGALCGLLAGVPPKMFNALEYHKGLTDERYSQTASSVLLPRTAAMSHSTGSKIIAALVNNTVVGVSGVIIAYLLSLSGRDRAVMKGAFFGAVEWIFIWGLAGRLGLKVMSRKPLTHILSFIDHVMFGAGTAALVSRLGDDSLFPDTGTLAPGEKLPLASNSPQRLWLRRKRPGERLKGSA